MLKTKLITTAECMPLRSVVLRWGQSYDQCTFKEDNDASTFHLGTTFNGKIVSVGTFIKNSNPAFANHKSPYQLRGLATDPEARGLGAGKLLLQKVEAILIKKSCQLLWFKAREKAFPFYEKSGYIEVDGVITVSEFGPHKVMFKKLR